MERFGWYVEPGSCGVMRFKSRRTPNNQGVRGQQGLLASNEELVLRPHLVPILPALAGILVPLPLHLTELT